ncbi:UvrD-helicase domain-containing protein [Leptolyngbya sp. 15MV]|nr:UvrD-helicase domain-containing protein [Leptolyngbya sp. 15MV]
MSGKVFALKDNQALAVDPQDSVWLSASAGTGKTQVLSARVLRLLLREDVAPEQILCLTFTKAGAAEMAVRVNEVLANWVRMKPEALASDLKAIGARFDPEAQARARTLFARVLDCPGGGLRIDTIHAFSQWLLAAFPEEAGLVPGTRPMEDRDRDVLAHAELVRLVAEWAETGEHALTAALEMLSVRMGADGARGWLMRCSAAREAWSGPGGWQDGDIAARVKALLGLAADAGEDAVAALCADEAFDTEALRLCLSANRAWGTKTAATSIEAIEAWLAADPAARVALCDPMRRALFTLKDEPRQLGSLEKHESMYAHAAGEVLASLTRVGELQALLALVDLLVPALTVGRKFALAWEDAKAREGLIDFDDQIRRAAALLERADMAEWIRFKLDRRFDHILIDEAQDTNAAQWSIIRALTDDFFSGAGQREGRQRTIFVVGDYKQAIFGFQGTSPENFETARAHFDAIMAGAAENARAMRANVDARELQSLGLGRSYRTAQPVLNFVDRAIASVGPENFGLKHDPEPHVGDVRAGEVVLWQPILARGEEPGEDDDGPESWISEPERRMADAIAAQVKAWLRDGYPLVKGGARNATAGDVMVLVRKRRELAGLIVARLYAAGVPVAGVDRLRLGAPLAVKDLMAALRFAAQPLDDLSLANLLVSPLFGWSQHRPRCDAGVGRAGQRLGHREDAGGRRGACGFARRAGLPHVEGEVLGGPRRRSGPRGGHPRRGTRRHAASRCERGVGPCLGARSSSRAVALRHRVCGAADSQFPCADRDRACAPRQPDPRGARRKCDGPGKPGAHHPPAGRRCDHPEDAARRRARQGGRDDPSRHGGRPWCHGHREPGKRDRHGRRAACRGDVAGPAAGLRHRDGAVPRRGSRPDAAGGARRGDARAARRRAGTPAVPARLGSQRALASFTRAFIAS